MVPGNIIECRNSSASKETYNDEIDQNIFQLGSTYTYILQLSANLFIFIKWNNKL